MNRNGVNVYLLARIQQQCQRNQPYYQVNEP